MQTDTTRENPQAQAPQAADSNQDLAATAPGQLRVIKRNGTVVPYTDDKITVAITKAFLAVEGGTAAASSRIHDTAARLTEQQRRLRIDVDENDFDHRLIRLVLRDEFAQPSVDRSQPRRQRRLGVGLDATAGQIT